MSEARPENLLAKEVALLVAQVEEIKQTLTYALQQDELANERLDKGRLYNHLENAWADVNKLLTEHQGRLAAA